MITRADFIHLNGITILSRPLKYAVIGASNQRRYQSNRIDFDDW
jgi:hypothetical protein